MQLQTKTEQDSAIEICCWQEDKIKLKAGDKRGCDLQLYWIGIVRDNNWQPELSEAYASINKQNWELREPSCLWCCPESPWLNMNLNDNH